MLSSNRIFGHIACLVVGSALLAACASPGRSPGIGSAMPSVAPVPSATPSSAASASSAPIAVPTDDLLFEGKLLVCSDLPYPPQEFFDEQGNPVGSDIEIAQELARRLGLEAQIVNSVFDTILEAQASGKCDIVISAQTINDERLALVDMVPYFQAGATFVVQHGNPADIHTELDLCGRRIAAQSGTVLAQQIEGKGDYKDHGLSDQCASADKEVITLVEFVKDDEAIAALISGDVDAYFVDSPAAGYHVVQNISQLELSGLTLDVVEQGISIPKDYPALRDAITEALHAMMSDGTYLAILARYGVQDGSVAPPAGL